LQAYRNLARKLHPDKGGDPVAFAKLQAAFEVLSDPDKRQVYDKWAKELEFRWGPQSGRSLGAAMSGGPRGGTRPQGTKARCAAAQGWLAQPALKAPSCRYVRTGAAAGGAGMGGEDVLLDEFENLGLKCDPATQVRRTPLGAYAGGGTAACTTRPPV
jgi:DnaJ family protein A protein 2